MQYITQFRNKKIVNGLVKEIRKSSIKPITLMEICGGHTMAIRKFGILELLPSHINLISGPGCPVCVTDLRFIDKIIALSKIPNVIITTFGDLIKVPGSTSNLEKEKANGKDIRIVYSITNALKIARQNPAKKIVFPGIGFETTAPGTAAGIMTAKKEKLQNFYVLSAHKVMPPAMEALIDDGIKINGYICPGHVSTVTGTSMYKSLVKNYKVGCVVSGFEPVDILYAILKLVVQLEKNEPKVEIAYTRAVSKEGNKKAQQIMYEVFETSNEWWRGFGNISKSGLAIKKKYAGFNAETKFNIKVEKTIEVKGCICGSILKGLQKPDECKLFGIKCTPVNPIGACMVSSEGACQAFYRYKN